MYTNDMKFLESHEWVKVLDSDIVCIGISDHAQGLLGDIVYLELPKIGRQIKMNDTVGVVESVKAASDLYSPVSGEVIEVNGLVVSNPEIVNSSPHEDGWLFKVRLSNLTELGSLLNVDDYRKNL